MSNKNFIRVPLKNIITISKVITIHCYDLAPSYFNQGEKHDFWEMVYLDRGEIEVSADERSFKLSQGEVVFHSPDEFHSIKCDGRNNSTVFIITFDCRSSAMKFFSGKKFGVPPNLVSLIKRLIDESTNTFEVSKYPLTLLSDAPVGSQQLIRIYLEEFLIRMMRAEVEKQKTSIVYTSREMLDDSLATEIERYLSEKVYDKVSLDELAKHFHFGKSHLCDVFKKNTGMTIVQFFLSIKIREAKRLIRQNKMPICKISEKLSFETPAYFSRMFKKQTGMSPRAYKTSAVRDGRVYLEKETPLI